MFYYIQNEDDAKKLYNLFQEIYKNEKYKNLSDKELYYVVQERFIKENTKFSNDNIKYISHDDVYKNIIAFEK